MGASESTSAASKRSSWSCSQSVAVLHDQTYPRGRPKLQVGHSPTNRHSLQSSTELGYNIEALVSPRHFENSSILQPRLPPLRDYPRFDKPTRIDIDNSRDSPTNDRVQTSKFKSRLSPISPRENSEDTTISITVSPSNKNSLPWARVNPTRPGTNSKVNLPSQQQEQPQMHVPKPPSIPAPNRKSGRSRSLSVYPPNELVSTSKATMGRDEEGNKTINQYTTIRLLGKGSFGKVKLCRNVTTGELHAIKIINKSILKAIRRMGPPGLGQKDLYDINEVNAVKQEIAILKVDQISTNFNNILEIESSQCC
jgi:hypothetical protein